MKFELHCHSHYSRGSKIPVEAPQSPKEIMQRAKKIGLDGLALTDHRTNKGWKEAREEAKKQKIIFIPAIEIDTLSGHLIGLGLNDSVKNYMSLDDTLDVIHGQGAISVAPHPFDLKGEGIRNEIKKTDAVEVFNSLSLDKFSNKLAERNAEKIKKPTVVGSDAHSLEMLGSAINIMNAGDVDSVLKEIKRGNVKFEKNYVSQQIIINWGKMRMTESYDDIIKYIDKNYSWPKSWISCHMLNKFVLSGKSNDYWMWRYLARFSFGCSGIYSRIKLAKYY
ncbi:MAG: PHP domain-containing protein [Nanoarchaeota archaeon]|nr:PHP domain-containing protein [Nanoarchaeota archaeon]MBU1135240.1 PHP domain-containing protein [Nanoarchaeota archaeon]MBU2519910.1 PHP domain-containing protein [Nanoarchaeota archaeon]